MNYMGNSGRNTHNDMNRGFYKRPSPQRDLRFRDPVTQPEATPELEMIQMGPMSAGYDFGNRRPIYDRNGNLVPQRPVLRDSGSSTVPVPIMDYTGNMTAMAGKKTGKRPPLAMVPGNVVAPNVPEHTGYSNDMFKEDPYRSYNSGYRYNSHGLQPLYFG